MQGRHILILSAVFILWALSPSAEAACIKRHDVPIAAGTAPNGSSWNIKGTIGPNGGNCRDWLFGMEFEFGGGFTWGSGTGIPAGGHIGRGYQIEALDELLEDGSSRVVAGIVNGEVAKVQFTLSDNKRVSIRPKAPPLRLRRKVVWLHNVRYFVGFYPPEGFVTGVATFSASGQLLYRDKTFEGF